MVKWSNDLDSYWTCNGSHCVVTDSVNGCSDTTFVTIAEPSAVSASITTQDATNPTTANGTTISVTGGITVL